MEYHLKTFPNKLTGLVIEDHDSPSVAVVIMVRVGSRYEADKINGLAHFVEHTIFKGTSKRPTTEQIGMEVESLGAQMNAFTAQDYTGYYIKSPKEHFDNSIDVLSDMFLNSLFQEKEIEKERGVIIEEKRMYEDQPMERVVRLFNEELFRNHELGREIVGTEESIRNIKRNDFINFIDKFYSSRNTIIIVAGDVKKEHAFDQIGKLFESYSEKPEIKPHMYDKRSVKCEKYNVYKPIQQSHLVLGGFGPSRLDENRYIFKVANAILGQGFSSRLFQIIRDKLGLAYYVYSSLEQYNEVGALNIGMGVENTKVQQAINAVVEELMALKKGQFRDDELVRAKNYLVGHLTIGLETSDDIAMWYGSQLLLNKKVLSIEQVKQKILAVTRDQIMEILTEYISSDNLLLASVSPHKSLDIELST